MIAGGGGGLAGIGSGAIAVGALGPGTEVISTFIGATQGAAVGGAIGSHAGVLGRDIGGFGGSLAGGVGSGLSPCSFESIASRKLYVHLTESDYEAVCANGYLGRGYQGAKGVFLPPFDEGRIWATRYTLDELQGARGILAGIDPGTLAKMTRTIQITDEAASGFSLAVGPGYSLNPFGWLKAGGGQYQFRGLLPYQPGEAISTLDAARYFSTGQQAIYRLGELERLGIYSSPPIGVGIYYYRKSE